MTETISETDRDVFAREAFASIEAVLDRRCPEFKNTYWTAVELLYRLDCRHARQPDHHPRAAAGPDLAVATSTPPRSVSA